MSTLARNIPEVHTKEVDGYRKQVDVDLISQKMRWTVNEIARIDVISWLEKTINLYFSSKKYNKLKTFFWRHPHVYKDLIRKIHKHKEYKDGKWQINPEKLNDIATLFLVRWRQSDLGKEVYNFLWLIVENSQFIEFCSAQPSILDYSAYEFSRIPTNKRKSDIERLIRGWLIQNIEWCHEESVDRYYLEAFELILSFLEEEFWTYTKDLYFCRNIKQLSSELNSLLESGWRNRKKAWKIIQAFHAWWNVIAIKNLYNEALAAVWKFPDKIKKNWIDLKNITSEIKDWVQIFYASTLMGGISVELSWRVKTPKSILLKMWETEEYTNADAMRDLIGLSVVYPDETTGEEKQKIILKFWDLMSNYWYILKNKWELSGESWGLEKTEEELKRQWKSPLYTSSDIGDSTDPNLRNTSMSWFSRIGNFDTGFEIQYSTKSAMEWKKKADPKYKPRSAILALIRWPKETTPQEIFNLLNTRLTPDDLSSLWYDSINQFILKLIESGFLIPYMSHNQRVVLLTTKKYEERFLRLWSDDKLKKQDVINEWIRRYILSLKQHY